MRIQPYILENATEYITANELLDSLANDRQQFTSYAEMNKALNNLTNRNLLKRRLRDMKIAGNKPYEYIKRIP